MKQYSRLHRWYRRVFRNLPTVADCETDMRYLGARIASGSLGRYSTHKMFNTDDGLFSFKVECADGKCTVSTKRHKEA